MKPLKFLGWSCLILIYPTRDLAFGASEHVKVSSDAIIPSSQPVKKNFLN